MGREKVARVRSIAQIQKYSFTRARAKRKAGYFFVLHSVDCDFTADINVGSINRLFIGVRSPSRTEIMDISTLLHDCLARERYTQCDLVPFLHNCSIYHDLSLRYRSNFQCVVEVGQEGPQYEDIVIAAASGRKISSPRFLDINGNYWEC